MAQPVSILLVAVGGYGNNYVSALLDAQDRSEARIVGVVDPIPERCRRVDELRALGVPFCDSLEAYYDGRQADLAVIASPIYLHCPHTCAALEHGSHVLCEKPLGATVQEADRMIGARDSAGRFVAIGYQWSHSRAVRRLKADVRAGRYGRLQRARTLTLWPRSDAYYARNNWAGARDDGAGTWILDSPVNNATAHYLHNVLYVMGPEVDRSLRPASVSAELYRARDISNYDTGVARIQTADGAEILYIASHAVRENRGPEFIYEFEQGSIRYTADERRIVGQRHGGETVDYGDPDADGLGKLWQAVAVVRGEQSVVCGPEAASAQTLVANGMQESVPEITAFPPGLVMADGPRGERVYRVDGLDELLARCYDTFAMPSDLGTNWAVRGREVDLRHYTRFPGGG